MTFGVLTLIVCAGLAGPLLSGMTRLAVPLVVGEIAAGVVIGRTGFHLLDLADPTLTFLSQVGFAMLMFVVGTHLPLRDPRLRGATARGLVASALSFAVAAPVGFAIAAVSDIPHPAIFLLLAATSSAAVVMPIVGERKLGGNAILTVTAWVAITDVVTVVALPLALAPSRAARIVVGGVAVAAAAVALWAFAKRTRPQPWVHALRKQSKRHRWALDLRISLVALFGLATLASRFGTSVLVAGFTAGAVVALSGGPKRLTQQLLGVAEGIFVPLFFVTLGARLDFRALAGSRSDVLLAAGLAASVVACHVAVAMITRLPAAAGLLASAQLGVPSAVVSLGLSSDLLTPGHGAAIIAAAVVTLAAAAAGAGRLSRMAETTVATAPAPPTAT